MAVATHVHPPPRGSEGFGEDLDWWIENSSALSQRLSSVAIALQEQAELNASLPGPDAVQTSVQTREASAAKERRRREARELIEECRRKDRELVELNARASSATMLRDEVVSQVADLRIQCEVLKQTSEQLANRDGHKTDVFNRALNETAQLRGLIRQLNTNGDAELVSQLGSDAGTVLLSCGIATPQGPETWPQPTLLVPLRPDVSTPRTDTSSPTSGRSPRSPRAIGSTLRVRPRSVEAFTAATITTQATIGSPRPTSVPAMRRVRFAERLLESPRTEGPAVATALGGSIVTLSPSMQQRLTPTPGSPRLLASSSREAVALGVAAAIEGATGSLRAPLSPGHSVQVEMIRTGPPRGMVVSGPTMMLSAIAGLRGEVETVSAVAGSVDPARCRSHMVSAVHRRIPMSTDAATVISGRSPRQPIGLGQPYVPSAVPHQLQGFKTI